MFIVKRGAMVMVFNSTFNNISVISWWSVVLMEDTGVPGETTDLLQVTDKHYHIIFCIEHISSSKSGIRTHNVSGDRHRLHI